VTPAWKLATSVFWRHGLDGGINLFSLRLAATATVAAFRFNAGMIPAIISYGLFGVAWRLLAKEQSDMSVHVRSFDIYIKGGVVIQRQGFFPQNQLLILIFDNC